MSIFHDYSQASTNGHLWQAFFFVVLDSPYIDFYFNSQLLNDWCTQNNAFHPNGL